MKKLLSIILVISMLVSVFLIVPVSADTLSAPQYFEDFEGKDNGEGVMIEDATETATSGYSFVTSATNKQYHNGLWTQNMNLGTNTTGGMLTDGRYDRNNDESDGNEAVCRNDLQTSKLFNIPAEAFENAGTKLEYSFDLYVTTKAWPQMAAYLTANSNTSGTKISDISRTVQLVRPSDGNLYLKADSATLNEPVQTGKDPNVFGANYYFGINGAGGTTVDTNISSKLNKWYNIKSVVSFAEGYYITHYYIDDVLVTNTDGTPVELKVKQVEDVNGKDAADRQNLRLSIKTNNPTGAADKPIAIDNISIKLYEAPKYENEFTSQSDAPTGKGVYEVADGVLKLKSTDDSDGSGVNTDFMTFTKYGLEAEDFEKKDKYLEYGYKLYVPPTEEGVTRELYSLLRFYSGTSAVQFFSRGPQYLQWNRSFNYYDGDSLKSETSDGNLAFAANNSVGVDADDKLVLKGLPSGTYDVRAVVKYVEGVNTGYYDTYFFVNGKLLLGNNGEAAVYRVEQQQDMTNISRTIELGVYWKHSEATNPMTLDDLYIRLVDKDTVDLSDITIDPATGKATVAYLNTTGSDKSSNQLTVAAFKDGLVLDLTFVKAQTLTPGAGIFSANLGSVAGATNYRAFYWNDDVKPLLPAVDADVSAEN